MPARIQRQRTPGWRAPEEAVYVGRPGRWANPWITTQTPRGTGWVVAWAGSRGQSPHVLVTEIPASSQRDARALAVELYETWLHHQPRLFDQVTEVLAGRDLTCWCPLPKPGEPDYCHGTVLLQLANR
ncbi:DUF4326 domain-containing protein [Streptomyces sp. XH2]|uniref:DUF4326 domain-containing protein n=1 Tax=Streptomyces sp. XH2 TaxID=3412483 RepID=UPI003C7A166C